MERERSRWCAITNPHASHLKQSRKMAKSSTSKDPVSNVEFKNLPPVLTAVPTSWGTNRGSDPNTVTYLMCPPMLIAYTKFNMKMLKKKSASNCVFWKLTFWPNPRVPGGGVKNDSVLALFCHVVVITTKFTKVLHNRFGGDRVTDRQTALITISPYYLFFQKEWR